jgi:hypothetical protein
MNETKTVNLDEMSIVELKALAYDIIAQKEKLQNDLIQINQAIAQKTQAVQTVSTSPVVQS